MTNEELVCSIQAGARDHVQELWAQVEQFVRFMANKQMQRLPVTAGVEFDDLYHAGYLAFVAAIDRYDAERDTAFITLLTLTLKTAFLEACGYRSKKQQRDPIHTAISFETPLSGDDELHLGDTLSDKATMEEAEHRIFLEQLQAEMHAVLTQLEGRQRQVIRRRFYNQDKLQNIGDDMGITKESVRQIENKALRHLRRPQITNRLHKFMYPEQESRIDRRTNFYYHVGADRFNNTGSSGVEELVFKREEWRAKEREIDQLLADSDRQIEQILEEMPWLREKVTLIPVG